ncbi:MAG: hypothetical protein ACMUHB_01195 [Thermoplasmatota archaeon]
MKERRIRNTYFWKALGQMGLFFGILIFVIGAVAVSQVMESPFCSAVFFLLLIPIFALMVMLLKVLPFALIITEKSITIRFPMKKTVIKTEDLMDFHYSKERSLMKFSTDPDLIEVGSFDAPKGADVEKEVRSLIPQTRPSMVKAVGSDDTESYIKTIIERFRKQGVEPVEKELKGEKFIVLPEYKGKDLFTKYREFFYFYPCTGELTKDELKRICAITRRYTNTSFRYPWYMRMVQAYTTPIFISGDGFSKDVIDHVTDNRMGRSGGDSVWPVLVDLRKCRLIALENYQIRPGNQLENIPTKRHGEGLRRKLYVKGWISIHRNHPLSGNEVKRSKKKKKPKESTGEFRFRKGRMRGSFRNIPNRHTQPTVLIFLYIGPTVLIIGGLLAAIFGNINGIAFLIAAWLMAGIFIGVMWKDVFRKDSLKWDSRGFLYMAKRTSIPILYKDIIEVVYFKGSRKMAVGIVSNGGKLIIVHDYFKMEEKVELLAYLKELADQFGFDVFRASNENNYLFRVKKLAME